MGFDSDVSDASLIGMARNGDLDAFNRLAQKYERQIYNVSLRALGDVHMAEDVTQETLIRAYRGLAGFRGGSLRAWLLRIASNTCIDIFRSGRSRRETSLESLTEESGVAWASPGPSPEDEAMTNELGREIQRGLLQLPHDQRIALVLVDVEGMSYQEASLAMSISSGTLRSRLSRARTKLRDYLLQKEELLPSSFRQHI